MKNKPQITTGTVIDFRSDAVAERSVAIEAELCDLRSINTLLHQVVDGERFTPARDHLIRSMETHLDQVEALLSPQA
jgi:hypothetical protein